MAQGELRKMSCTVMMMHKNERPGVTKQPTPWYTAGAQPKYGIIPTRGGKDSNSKDPKVNAFIYIKLVFTPCILSKMAPVLVARQRVQE